MKYNRLTPKDIVKTINYNQDNQDITPFLSYALRLYEIENKIESGEFIYVKEQGDSEIAFFVAHNASVRRRTVIEILHVLQRLCCVATDDNYGKGWGEAIKGAYEFISEKYGINAEEEKDD